MEKMDWTREIVGAVIGTFAALYLFGFAVFLLAVSSGWQTDGDLLAASYQGLASLLGI